jgi:hypothetical protein
LWETRKIAPNTFVDRNGRTQPKRLEASFDANRPEMFETFFPRFRHRKSRPKKVIDHRKKIKEREKEKNFTLLFSRFRSLQQLNTKNSLGSKEKQKALACHEKLYPRSIVGDEQFCFL